VRSPIGGGNDRCHIIIHSVTSSYIGGGNDRCHIIIHSVTSSYTVLYDDGTIHMPLLRSDAP
jgi:hypothetical protein